MAFKGTASKSASGASMSKYDVEVEARLKALEEQAHPDRACTDDGGGEIDSDLQYAVYESLQLRGTDPNKFNASLGELF